MKTETKTAVIDPGTSGNPSEVVAMNESFMRNRELSKEQHALRKFGLLGFDDYCAWILENQLPLS